MLSAHAPYGRYPEQMKIFAREVGATAQVAGGVPAMCDGVTQGQPGMQSQMGASADLAARLVSKASGRLELRPNPHRFASFHVLRRAEAPAVLFEAGYVSNADDEVLLRTPEQRSKIALALAQAIETDVAAHARH